MSDQSILWRRLDQPGHEVGRLSQRDSHWHLSGTAVFAHKLQPCRLDYAIVCDSNWRTRSASVRGWVGDEIIDVAIQVDEAHRWRINGAECPSVEGCIDIDLNFSPSTNLLPIRRRDLAAGQEAEVRAAWLRFPSFTLEPLMQIYRRIDQSTYRYESGGGRFVTELKVNRAGFVTSYPNIWEIETGSDA